MTLCCLLKVIEYHRIDEDEIFRVITSDLQPLLKQVQKMKSEL